MRIGYVAASIALVGVPGVAHAAKLRLDVQAQDTQTARMDNGLEAVDDDKAASSVRLFEAEEPVSKRGVLMVYVINAGEKPLNFGIENVTIATDDGTLVEMISYDRLVSEEKSRQKWAMIGAALGGFAGAMNAASAGNTYGTVNTFGSGGWAHSSFNVYNPAAANLAMQLNNAQTANNFQRIGETSAANMAALKSNLRTTTVDPGVSFGGQIMYELPKNLRKPKAPVPVTISVKMGEEVHTFKAVLAKEEKKKKKK